QIAGIQIGKAKGVDVRGGAGFVVDVIVAVTQRIDVGVTAGAAVELVVTQAAKEDIIGGGSIQRVVAGRSSDPGSAENLIAIPRGIVGEHNLLDPARAAELILNRERLSGRNDPDLEIIVAAAEGNVRGIETNQLDNVRTSVGCAL